tara:strand:+ start:1343 stop:1498 length:156 start_codon:yes stop_codon:yes gene_type:complete
MIELLLVLPFFAQLSHATSFDVGDVVGNPLPYSELPHTGIYSNPDKILEIS